MERCSLRNSKPRQLQQLPSTLRRPTFCNLSFFSFFFLQTLVGVHGLQSYSLILFALGILPLLCTQDISDAQRERKRERKIHLRSGISTLVFRLYVEMMVERGRFKFWNVLSINCLPRKRRNEDN